MKKILLITLSLAAGLIAGAQTADGNQSPQPAPTFGGGHVSRLFNPAFQAKTVTILSEKEARDQNVPSALVRNPNGKLAVMARDRDGELQPFYVKGIEVGFWDTRRGGQTDYNKVFDAYNKVGANTVMFMIHWSDIEPQDGKFDFSYTDDIVEKAKSHGLKIVWILFMHEQFDMPFLPDPEKQWMYNLDTRDGVNYAIQWVKDKEGNIIKDIPAQRAKRYSEIMPCYSHPVVFGKILRMLDRLAGRYAKSDAVIGIQIGNEEHFSYQGEASDYNPHTLASFEQWKKQTGETSWVRFKMDAVNAWFARFTTVYHRQAPYQITMLNPIGGGPEKGEAEIVIKSGTDATTFRDSKIDAIASMYYGTSARKQWKNLDQVYMVNNTYSYPTQLPILISTEIGIRYRSWSITQEYMINFIERGSQGFAVFSYGGVGNREGEPSEGGECYRKFMAMVTANEDIIWPGLPGAGDNILITATCGEGKISCLHNGDDATLGILHFPDDMAEETRERKAEIPVEVTVKKPGKYTVEIYKDGVLSASHVADMTPARSKIYYVNLTTKEAAFIKVKAACGCPACCGKAESPASLERGEPSDELKSAMKMYLQATDEQKLKVQSVMVLQHGKVLFEKWLNGGEPGKPHVLNSVSKTFTATAVGLAVGEGLLRLDDKVINYFPAETPANPSENLKNVTIKDLLTMSCGHDTAPGYPGADRKETWSSIFLSWPVKHEPGTFYCYNGLGTYMLSAIVQKVTGQKVVDYLQDRLFDPLKIDPPHWDESPQGINKGGSGLYLKTEDLAKMGQMLLQKGEWYGQRIISEDWVAEATRRQVPCVPSWIRFDEVEKSGLTPANSDWLHGYGFQMWRCRHNAVRADGAGGQYIILIPDKDAVVVNTADLHDMQAELNLVWEYILPALD